MAAYFKYYKVPPAPNKTSVFPAANHAQIHNFGEGRVERAAAFEDHPLSPRAKKILRTVKAVYYVFVHIMTIATVNLFYVATYEPNLAAGMPILLTIIFALIHVVYGASKRAKKSGTAYLYVSTMLVLLIQMGMLLVIMNNFKSLTHLTPFLWGEVVISVPLYFWALTAFGFPKDLTYRPQTTI